MKVLFPFYALLVLTGVLGCSHSTSMSDPHLRDFYRGKSLSQEEVKSATQKWPNDDTLIEMQAAFNLLREGDFSPEARAQAKNYLARATTSFNDLKQPNNFSTAFTADAKSPYKGRPYERVLASLFLGILDMADGRCDMAIPSFKSAEFLDARWQPFQFGSDAPLIYALALRCLKQNASSNSDIIRAKEGLFRSLRLLESIDEIRIPLDHLGKNVKLDDPALQISFLIVDAGISSALMESKIDAQPEEILDRVVSDSLRFYIQVLSNKEDVMFDTLQVLAKKLENSIGAKDKIPSSQGLAHLERTLKDLVKSANKSERMSSALKKRIEKANSATDAIDRATSQPKTILLFDGKGPKVVAEGEYKEIAKIVPSSEAHARAKVDTIQTQLNETCGVHPMHNGAVNFVLCDDNLMHSQKTDAPSKVRSYEGIKLWSSSYQATSMVGRRFDKVLRGRAQFRLGADSAALIGAATATALLDAGNQYERDCRYYGRNCEAARNLQLAGALAGIFAGAAWLTGKTVNPEADTRYLPAAFESGYLMLHRND